MTALDDLPDRVTDPVRRISRRRVRRLVAVDATTTPVATPRSTPTLERRRLWERRYRSRLIFTDTVVVLLATSLSSVLMLALLVPTVLASDPWIVTRVPLVTALTWMLALAALRTREHEVIGVGATEYKRVAHATGLAFGILAIAFVIFQWEGIRTQLLVGLPAGLLLLLLERWSWRRWLLSRRRTGDYVARAIVVGHRVDVEYVIDTLQKHGQVGYLVVGATLDGDNAQTLRVGGQEYPVLGTPETIARIAGEFGADAIIVASQPDYDAGYVKHLSWELEGTASELILSSRLVDVAGPRISFRQVDGLPLIHVKIPAFEGGQYLLKRALDIFVSSIALVGIAVVLPFIALAIKLDSKGPVFFLQQRVGRDGRQFAIVKFRTMSATAEKDLGFLRELNEGSGPLFKLKIDPRVTRVGRVLRKYSLDELPQFWNVFFGEMSVVGPRPPLPSEVTLYDGTVFRRLYINPGITGVWQVGGRSDLSWDESVRLDLRYVENWSVMNDLMIMWQTVKVMFRPTGAY